MKTVVTMSSYLSNRVASAGDAGADLQPKPRGWQTETLLRALILVYVVLVESPIRYWRISSEKIDASWVFALNYGASQGLRFGRDLIWTNGPLGFLTFPQNIGHNLAYGLLFQVCAWVVLAAILADLFLRAGIPLRNLGLFSLAVGVASPLFWYNYNDDYLFLAGALTLLVLVRFQGGIVRYITALAIIGIIPLIKPSGGIDAALALGGFLIDRVIQLRWKAWREVALAAVVPLASAAVGLWLTLPSVDALEKFVRGTWEILSGYSAAQSKAGSSLVLAAAGLTLAAVFWFMRFRSRPEQRRFFALFLGLPLLFGIKHGFVRQDNHVLNFFCFAVLAVGFIGLYTEFGAWRELRWLKGWGKYVAVALVLPLAIVIASRVATHPIVLGQPTGLSGLRAMYLAWMSATSGRTRDQERALMGSDAPGPSVDPEIKAILNREPVSFLSLSYSEAYFDNLQLRIYPVVQRFNEYTPYLDNLNAEWVRTKGPRYLVFVRDEFERRHPWTEAPAMWAEIYRLYETRLLSNNDLLLERRSEPRFKSIAITETGQMQMPGELIVPSEDKGLFWSLDCRLGTSGVLRKLFWRVPETTMIVETDGQTKEYRSITSVLSAPVMGAWLPDTLPEFAAVLQHDPAPRFRVKKLIFGGPGASSYQSTCMVRWARPL
jgi:hypothetical protein